MRIRLIKPSASGMCGLTFWIGYYIGGGRYWGAVFWLAVWCLLWLVLSLIANRLSPARFDWL